MTKSAGVLILSLLLVSAVNVLAQEISLTTNELEARLVTVKNPFQSKLPEKIIEPDPALEITLAEDPALANQETEQTPPPPEPEPVIPLPNLTIHGVIWDSERPQAIINDQIVDVGDTILEITITDIQKTYITGEFHGRSVTIQTQRSLL